MCAHHVFLAPCCCFYESAGTGRDTRPGHACAKQRAARHAGVLVGLGIAQRAREHTNTHAHLLSHRLSLHSLARARACMCVLHVLSRTFLRETSCARERARAVCMCVYPRARESGCALALSFLTPSFPVLFLSRTLTHSLPKCAHALCVCVCTRARERAAV